MFPSVLLDAGRRPLERSRPLVRLLLELLLSPFLFQRLPGLLGVRVFGDLSPM